MAQADYAIMATTTIVSKTVANLVLLKSSPDEFWRWNINRLGNVRRVELQKWTTVNDHALMHHIQTVQSQMAHVKQASTVADKPTQCAASCSSCCTQRRTLSVKLALAISWPKTVTLAIVDVLCKNFSESRERDTLIFADTLIPFKFYISYNRPTVAYKKTTSSQ